MRTLVFSDSHLEDTVDEKKYRLLEHLITASDRVIINGDFWDGFLVNFDSFINSPYRRLFPLFKQKKTVYITGNHDHYDFIDNRVNLFSVKNTQRYELPLGKKTLIFEHGHMQVPIFKNENPVLKKYRYPISSTLNKVEEFLVRNTGGVITKLIQKNLNETIKKTIKSDLKKDDIFICGHTHYAEFSLDEQFINIGIMKHGLAQYLVIENETIIPKSQWYR